MTANPKSINNRGAAGPLTASAVAGLVESISVLDKSDSTEMVHPGIQEQLLKSAERDADIVILGSGPAGYVGAIRAAQLGARVVVVEKGAVGGTCLNIGCVPTKVLLACVAIVDAAKSGEEFGVKIDKYDLDIPTMMSRKNSTVRRLVGGVESLFKKNQIRLVRGVGRLSDQHTVTVQTESGVETIRAGKIIIATGSTTALLPIPGFEIGENVWTSTEALSFDKIPESMLVIGAGAIGLEAGYTLARLGTNVLVVEMKSQILPAADTETANELMKSLKQAGMKFMVDSTVSAAEDIPGGKRVTIKTGDKEEVRDFEKVLVAIGRRPATDNIGLDEIGIKHDRGKIIVDEHMRTNVSDIYAAGDCTGEPMLAHVGWTECIAAVEDALGMGSRMDYHAIPACVYTTPECASVGLTEEQARERYKDVRVGRFLFRHNSKAMAIGGIDGFVKVLSEGKYGEILGVHMVGPHVTDLIAEAVVAMRNELTVDELVASIHPHPTLSEAVQEAAYDALGRAIHK
ncbi:MAG: dihydrolipoyl dehydrogenase [Armatimonadota bacterium]